MFALLQEVERGEVALSPGLASRVLNEFRRRASLPPGAEVKRPPESLSPRETQVLTLVAQGLTYKEVGAKLYLAERTIKYHMGEIVGPAAPREPRPGDRVRPARGPDRRELIGSSAPPPRPADVRGDGRATGEVPAPFLSLDCPPGHGRASGDRATLARSPGADRPGGSLFAKARAS